MSNYPELPEPFQPEWPDLNSSALGCGVEDRGLRDRYECAEYGWQDGVDRAAERVPDDLFTAEQMRAYADADRAMRADETRDAERYRSLRNGGALHVRGEWSGYLGDYCRLFGDQLDAAIDAAMKAQP